MGVLFDHQIIGYVTFKSSGLHVFILRGYILHSSCGVSVCGGSFMGGGVIQRKRG